MNHRLLLRYGHLVALLALLAAIVPTGGCTSALATAMWVIQGTNADAEFDKLRNQRVAVVCRPLVNLTYRNSSVAKDLAREMSSLLRQNVSKVKVIDQREVAEWVDEHTWDEYTEVGKALEADMVVGVDLESFSILEGQTVYQGKANVLMKVFDCHSGEVIFEKRLPQVIYPPNNVVPAADRQEADFRREFVAVLADQIARHFYAHDRYADFAMDAKAFH